MGAQRSLTYWITASVNKFVDFKPFLFFIPTGL